MRVLSRNKTSNGLFERCIWCTINVTNYGSDAEHAREQQGLYAHKELCVNTNFKNRKNN